MELTAGLWSKLPSELQEQVLSLLPVPDLCRYRSVCRSWNSLISTQEFGALCIQNTTSGANRGECLVVNNQLCVDSPYTGPRCVGTYSWSIFDFDTKRWYNVTDALPKGYDHDVMAMDGGLVCTFGNALTDEQRQASTVHSGITSERQILIVSDLIKKTTKVLPNPPRPYINLKSTYLRLVVDNISRTYKIFLLLCESYRVPRDGRLCIYESSTNQWQIAPSAPCIPLHSSGEVGRHVCSAVYQGVLHVLFAARQVPTYRLYSYNNSGDYWEDTGVQVGHDHILDLDGCDLVVSDNRLFLMTRCVMDLRSFLDVGFLQQYPNMYAETDAWPLDISEILLAEKDCKTVVQMTPAEVFRNFEVQAPNNRATLNASYYIRAHGFDKSILLMSEKVHGGTGKYVLYNVVTGLWEVLPPNTGEYLHLCPRLHWTAMCRHGERMSYPCLPNVTPW